MTVDKKDAESTWLLPKTLWHHPGMEMFSLPSTCARPQPQHFPQPTQTLQFPPGLTGK